MKQWKQRNMLKAKRIGRTAGYSTRRGTKPVVTRLYSKEQINKINGLMANGLSLSDSIKAL